MEHVTIPVIYWNDPMAIPLPCCDVEKRLEILWMHARIIIHDSNDLSSQMGQAKHD